MTSIPVQQSFGKGPFALRTQEVFIGMGENRIGTAYCVTDARGNEVTPYLKAEDAKWIYEALTEAYEAEA